MNKMTHGLYRITFPNGKCYHGISRNPRERYLGHLQASRKGENFPVNCAIRHFGEDKLKFEILAIGNREYIADLEIKAISYFDSKIPNGYNLLPGGQISPVHTEEVRLKMAASMKKRYEDPEIRKANSEAQKIAQNNPAVKERKSKLMTGKRHTDETKKKMSASHKGRVFSEETIRKSAESRRGQKRTEESKTKMSLGQKARIRTPEELSRMSSIAKMHDKTNPEYREKCRQAALRRWAKKKQIVDEE